MSDIANTTRAQTLFLRAFRKYPGGPPADAWPSPAVFRKWLRRPAFRAALRSVQAALRFRADFQLASAADHAAHRLTAAAQDSAAAEPTELKKLADILRLAHLRQRFPADAQLEDATLKSPATFELRHKIQCLENEIEDLEDDAAERKARGEPPRGPDELFSVEDSRRELAELRAKTMGRRQ